MLFTPLQQNYRISIKSNPESTNLALKFGGIAEMSVFHVTANFMFPLT